VTGSVLLAASILLSGSSHPYTLWDYGNAEWGNWPVALVSDHRSDGQDEEDHFPPPLIKRGQTFQRMGAFTFGSDGTTYVDIGASTFGSDGTSYQHMGSFTFRSDGTTYLRMDTTTFGSDGTTYQQMGPFIFGSDGTTCTTIGSFTSCP
jgi:hypothetical protein